MNFSITNGHFCAPNKVLAATRLHRLLEDARQADPFFLLLPFSVVQSVALHVTPLNNFVCGKF